MAWLYLPISAIERCHRCGAQLGLIAFVTAAEPVARILTHRGGPSRSCRARAERGASPLPARDEEVLRHHEPPV